MPGVRYLSAEAHMWRGVWREVGLLGEESLACSSQILSRVGRNEGRAGGSRSRREGRREGRRRGCSGSRSMVLVAGSIALTRLGQTSCNESDPEKSGWNLCSRGSSRAATAFP